MNSNNNIVPPVQRALVLQGGGALGAYEVGVLKALCENIKDKENCNKHGQLFDIVAGTSICAMNAAVLVSNVVNRKKKWDEAVEELEKFWTDEKDGLSSIPENDIKFLDRNSHYDENVFNTVTDHVAIIYKLKDLAKSYIASDRLGEFGNDFEKFLKTKAKSKSHTEEDRMYKDILDSRFVLT